MKVSIQGNKGSYHDVAAHECFAGVDIDELERDTFKEVFADVSEGRAEAGVIAIENSIAGSILENYDLLLKNDLHIRGEHYLRISHQLMALPGTTIDEITEVRSHPMAIKQCQNFLDRYPDWRIVEAPDTAGSAALIRRRMMDGTAAIASRRAAELYELDIIAENIETNEQNYTRFLVISKNDIYSPDADKTSIVFKAADKPGSLAAVLTVFADLGINLSKIESRPVVGRSFRYYFYTDFDAGLHEARTQKALREIDQHTSWLQILGSYRHGKLFE
ncbi:MAG: P-protein [candidate division WS6 bacterium OLB20]|uniref:Prephenate dehydratase n=1 Tax=candidate division WS6 bacterium OLB20 TaxID=1617426 RepID=A0A136LXV6_9BACT|nr:MAG: P-protein [candidate division WS6 bacterium OLB20]